MKMLRTIAVIVVVIILQACHKPGEIRVQNNISKAVITDVKWGDIRISNELLPGETSSKTKIDRHTQKLPARNTVSFIMNANQKSIYLVTDESYLLDEDDLLHIVLDDNTKVSNPNR